MRVSAAAKKVVASVLSMFTVTALMPKLLLLYLMLPLLLHLLLPRLQGVVVGASNADVGVGRVPPIAENFGPPLHHRLL